MDAPTKAAEIAAIKTGLRPDQIVAAVHEYRASLAALAVEPAWRFIMHMHGQGMAIAQYVADGTEVAQQIDSWKERGEWRQETHYTFRGKPFETYAEAKAAEDIATSKFTIRAIPEKKNG